MCLLLACLVVGALAAAGALAAGASAAIPGPSSLQTGLVDPPVFQNSPDSVRIPWFTRAQQIDSSWVRLDVFWSLVAPKALPPGFNAADPSDPGYHWTSLDETVRQAEAHGQKILMVVLSAPSWAQGPGMPPSAAGTGAWMPSPNALAAFAHAIALRYSGHFADPLDAQRMLPTVSYFQAWNEPNLPTYLQPQWELASSGALLPASPGIYRAMLNAFYSAVKAVQPHSVVLSAGTAPYGDPPGVNRMYPTVFLQGLFCLSPALAAQTCSNLPHLDGLDHHPYGISPTVKAGDPGDVAVPDLGKITRIVAAAQRVHHVLPAGPKPLWITEIDWSTNPPSPGGRSPAVQARFVDLAFYRFWRAGVAHAFWYQLRDPLVPMQSFTGGGLFFGDGTAKPATATFRFPFLALPVGHSKTQLTVWGRAPTAGHVVISKLTKGKWQTVLRLNTTSGGIFYAKARLGSHLQLRAKVGSNVSPTWATS